MIGVYSLILGHDSNYSLRAPVNKMYKILSVTSYVYDNGNAQLQVSTRGFKRNQLDDQRPLINSTNNNVIFTCDTHGRGITKTVSYNEGVLSKFISMYAISGSTSGNVFIEVVYDIVDANESDIIYETLKSKDMLN